MSLKNVSIVLVHVLLGLPSLYEYIFVALILVIAGPQARSTKGFVK